MGWWPRSYSGADGASSFRCDPGQEGTLSGSRPLRIVWLSHSGDLAGAELCLLEAARCLRPRGAAVTVVVPVEGALKERLEAELISARVVPFRSWVTAHDYLGGRILRLGRNVLSLPAMTRLIRELDPDLVVTNTLTTPIAAVAAKVAGVPHVWYFHELGPPVHGMRYDWGERLSYSLIRRLSDVVVGNSEAVCERLRRHGLGGKERLVYYAVEVAADASSRALPESRRTCRLVDVAVLAPGKGIDDAIRAVGILRRKGLGVTLEVVGPDFMGYQSELETLAGRNGVLDAIRFHGFQHDPSSFIGSADIALTCSRGEAFGRVTIEAMKLGTPVIGAASGATPELVRDGWNGLLYEPGNATELASKIELAWNNPQLLGQLRETARKWAQANFSAERFGAELEAVFREAMSRPSGAKAN